MPKNPDIMFLRVPRRAPLAGTAQSLAAAAAALARRRPRSTTTTEFLMAAECGTTRALA